MPREEVKVLQSTQSLPVWMPSTVNSTDAPESIAEEVAAIKTPPLTPRAIEDANSSLFVTPTPGATPGATPVKGKFSNGLTLIPLRPLVYQDIVCCVSLLTIFSALQPRQLTATSCHNSGRNNEVWYVTFLYMGLST